MRAFTGWRPAAWLGAAPLLVLIGAVVLAGHRLGWLLPAVAGGLSIAALCAVSPLPALFLLGLLAPFDGYVTPLVVYRDVLAVDAIGVALILGELRRGLRVPAAPAVPAALLTLLAMGVLHVLSLGHANWTSALDNAARFLYFAVLVVAIISAGRRVSAGPVAFALVAGMTVRFAYEARAFVSHPDFIVHQSFQFGAHTSNPNSLGGFGAALLPLALVLIVGTGPALLRWAGAAAAVLITCGVVLSFSKGAWLTAAVGVAFWAWLALATGQVRRRSAALAVLGLLLAAAALPPVRQVPALMWERWTAPSSTISNAERVRYAETAAGLIVQRPVAGVGLERFAAEYTRSRRLLRGPDDPHNAYLMMAVELGVPALGLLLLFQSLVLVSAWRSATAAEPQSGVYAGLAATAAALLVFQLFSAEPLAARTSWLVAALCLTPATWTLAR